MSLRISEVTSGKSLDITNNARINVKATPGEKYYLIDEATGQTPKDLEVFREGDALYMRSAQYDVEVVIEEFWEACEAGNQCYAIFDTPAEVGGELIGQTIVTQEGEVLGALLAGEVGTLAENAAILGAWGGAIGSSAIIPSLVAVTGGLAVASMAEMLKSDDNAPEDNTPPSLTVVAPDQKAETNPTISGKTTAPVGTEVTITITDKDGKEIKSETAKVQKDGSYSVAFSDIPEGAYIATAVIKNTQGQEIAKASDPGSVAVAPEVKIEVPANTADTTPTIKGTAPAGSEVTITVKDAQGEEKTIKATADKNGNFSAEVPKALAEGEYTVTAIAKDAFGNTSEPVSKTGSVDRSLPEVTVEVPENTNDATPTIKGKAPAGSEVTITVEDGQGNKQTIKATADKNGNFSADVPTALADGAYKATAQVTAPNGKIVEASDNGNIDTVAPTLTLTIPENTADSTPTIKGHSDAPEGSKVAITVTDAQGNKQTIEATVKADGTFEVDVPTELADGEYTVQASVQDEAGNIATEEQAIKVDSSLPEVSVEVPENTNDATPAITGTAPAGSEVTITVEDGQGKEQTIKATADKDGNFSADVPEDLADGKYDVTAKATAPNGKTAEAKDHGTIDTVAPEVHLNAPDNSHTATPTLSGKTDAPAGSEVTITVEDAQGKEQTIKATVEPDGTFEAKIPEGLADGAYTAKATVVDAAGNKGASSDGGSVNTKAPDAPQSYQDNVGDVQSDASTAPTTDDTTPSLNIGKVPEGETPKLYDNGKEIPSHYDPATGTLTPKEPLGEGKHNLTYTLADKAGNESPQSEPIAITVDITAPNKPDAPQSYQDNVGDVQDSKSTAPTTDDTTPSLNIGKVPEGETPKLYDNDKEIPSVYDPATGTLTPKEPLSEGKHDLTYTLTDPAGNESPQSAPIAIEVIPSAPASAPNDGNAPVVEITTDTNNNGFIDKDEAKPTVEVKVSFDKDKVNEGDIVVVTDNTDPSNPDVKEIAIDAAAKANGYVEQSFAMPKEGSNINISGSLKNPAGAESDKGHDTAKLDTSNLSDDPAGNGVGIKIVEDANNDQVINKDELGNKQQISVEITLPKEAVAGDKLVVTGTGNSAQDIDLSPAQIAAGKVVIPFDAPANGTLFETTAKVSDAAGNESNLAKAEAKLDLNDIGAPQVAIEGQNGYINADQAKDGKANITITLPENAKAGETLTVADQNGNKQTITLSPEDIAKKTVATDLPLPKEGEAIEVTASITDQSGNTSPEGKGTATLDTSDLSTGLAVKITEDVNGDGFINNTELKDNDIDVEVTLPQGAQVGDTLTITGSGNTEKTITLAKTDLDKGTVTVKFTPPANNSDFIATATIKDQAGNTSGVVEDKAKIQLDTLAKPVVQITEDANTDGFINKDELKGDIGVRITLPSTAKPTDAVHIDTNGDGRAERIHTLEPQDIQKGYVDIELPSPGEGKTLTVDAWLQDAVGNVGEKADTVQAQIDTIEPNKPNAPQSYGDNVGADQSPNSTKPITDDTTPSLNIGKVPAGEEPKLYDNGKEIPAVYDPATGTLTPETPLGNGKHNLTYTLTDPAGNESEPSEPIAIEVRTDKLEAPTVTPSTTDGSVAVAPPADTKDGDTMTVKYTDEANQKQTATFTKENGNWVDGNPNDSLTIDPTTGEVSIAQDAVRDGSEVSATISTPAGVTSEEGKGIAGGDQGDAQTSIPTGGVTIDADANNDAIINGKEKGTATTSDVTVKLGYPKLGEEITLTDANGNVLGKHVIEPADVTAGQYTFKDIPLPAEGETLEVSASITKDANGADIAQPSSIGDKALIDTTAPNKPNAPQSYNDNVGDVQKADSTAPATDDTTPGINIGKVPEGETPKLYDNGTEIPAVYDPATGTLTPKEPLSEGKHDLSYTLTDPAGNESPQSDLIAIEVKTTAPTPTITIGKNDGGLSQGAITYDELTLPEGTFADKSDDTVSITIGIPDDAKAGDVLRVYTQGSATPLKEIPLTDAELGTKEVVIEAPIPVGADGKYATGNFTVKAEITDTIGNTASVEKTEAIKVFFGDVENSRPENMPAETVVATVYNSGSKTSVFLDENGKSTGTTSPDEYYRLEKVDANDDSKGYNIVFTEKGAQSAQNDFESATVQNAPNQTFKYPILATYADGTQKIGRWNLEVEDVTNEPLSLTLNSDTAGAGTTGTDSDNITSDGVINVNNTNGNPWEYSLDGGQTWQAGTGTSFTLPESTEPNGTPYSLVARVTGDDTTKATLNMTLDQVTEFKVNGASGGNDGTISGTGEAGGLVKIGYQDADGNEVSSEPVVVGADGKWTISAPTGWDSDVNDNNKVDQYAQITFVDKAGNTTKNGNNYLYVFDSLKNGTESYTVSDRPQGAAIYEGNFTGYGGKQINGLTFDYTPVKGNITIISTSEGAVSASTFSGTNAPSGQLRVWRTLTGDGDDTVIINGDVYTNVGFFLGEGNNRVEIGNGIALGSAKLAGSAGVAVVTGSGDDVLKIKNSSLDGAFDLGAGNNIIEVGREPILNFDRNRITTQEGNDKVTIKDDVLSSIINLGDGENTIDIGGRLDFGRLSPNDVDQSLTRVVAQIYTGKDKDVLTIGDRVDGGSVINLGDGDNILDVKGRVDGYSKITTGDGNDTIDIGGKVDGHSIIKTGAGNDTVTIAGKVDGNAIAPNAPNTLVDLGDGDDTLTLERVLGLRAEVRGGEGTDHLHITGSGSDVFGWIYQDINMDHIGGFEHIHLDGNKVNLDLNYSDLLSSASTGGVTGTVYIHGDNKDRVDLGDNGNSLNDNGGAWSAKATETVDNVEYQVYQHSADTAGEHLVYIQTGIIVI